jgi:zinc protease
MASSNDTSESGRPRGERLAGTGPLAILAAVAAGIALLSLLSGPGREPAPAVTAAKPPPTPAVTAAAAPGPSAPSAGAAPAVRPESRNVEIEIDRKAAGMPASAPQPAAAPPTATASAPAAPLPQMPAATPAAAPAAPPSGGSPAAAPPAALQMKAEATRMKIETVKSPGGIEAWLVTERQVPLLALRFAFEGGSSQDPDRREGLANFLSGMMDEGAGELDARAFQERMEELAMRMGFDDSRDSLYGSFETLTQNLDSSAELLTLALTRPRFDADAIERVRKQLLAGLAYAAKNPDRVAGKEWSRVAFSGHPYGRSNTGTPESIQAVTADDLKAFHRRIFARDTLKVVAVGDIDGAALGRLLDRIFGALPAKAELTPVAKAVPKSGGAQNVVEMDVPQSVAVFGMSGIPRKDPDFMAAFVLNQILGGGGFASRLMEQVREKRGLAYSVYSYLQPYQHAAIFAGGVATKNEEIGQSLDVIRAELRKMAEEGPTPEELANAKSYLLGSYALRFDTNAKIANALLAIRQDELGIDYVQRRNGEVEAVTLDDVRRVARRLLRTDDLIVTIVGKPKNLKGGG